MLGAPLHGLCTSPARHMLLELTCFCEGTIYMQRYQEASLEGTAQCVLRHDAVGHHSAAQHALQPCLGDMGGLSRRPSCTHRTPQAIMMQGVSSDEDLQRAQRDLVSATEAAAVNGPSSGVSAFAAPALQTGSAADVSQAKDLLGKVSKTVCMSQGCVARKYVLLAQVT